MTDVKDIRIEDYDYPLPDERIARHPLAVRDSCLLLVSRRPDECADRVFSDIPGLLPEDSLLICNDTRVINARISFRKPTGAAIEIFLLEPVAPADYVLMFQSRGRCRWACLVGNRKRWKDGLLEKRIEVGGRQVTLHARRLGDLPGNACEVEFEWQPEDVTFASVIDAAGYIPIPPYLKRDSEASDSDDYQTVYAEVKGSVAAPTAGLHFTPGLFEKIRGLGIETRHVTLHVGAGTFQPVKSDTIGDHPMHTETVSVDRDLVAALRDAVASGRKITAVGTTSVRTLESLPLFGYNILNSSSDEIPEVTQWQAYSPDADVPAGAGATDGADDAALLPAEKMRRLTVEWLSALVDFMDRRGEKSFTARTSIMIAPGFRWRIVDYMVTNFHQPQSTLLLLVSSFLGENVNKDNGKEENSETPRWRKLYDHALAADYRFLSYGDACFFARNAD